LSGGARDKPHDEPENDPEQCAQATLVFSLGFSNEFILG
jgi:hypothetical protein